MLPVGFGPAIPTRELQHTHALECSATGIDVLVNIMTSKCIKVFMNTLLRLKVVAFAFLDPRTLNELFHRFQGAVSCRKEVETFSRKSVFNSFVVCYMFRLL